MLNREVGRWKHSSGELRGTSSPFCSSLTHVISLVFCRQSILIQPRRLGLPDVLTFHFALYFNLWNFICVKWKVVLDQFSAVLEQKCCWSSSIFLDDERPGCILEFWLLATDVSYCFDHPVLQLYHFYYTTAFLSFYSIFHYNIISCVYIMKAFPYFPCRPSQVV